MVQSKVALPRRLMCAETARELFRFLAEQVENFLQTYHMDRLKAHIMNGSGASEKDSFLKLGFTFSFAFSQQSLNEGKLLYWTKGFNIPDAIGQDVCALLQEQLDELHVPVLVAALVNDTVGTLVARSYQSPGSNSTVLGAVFGTGTNGAYVEKAENITKLRQQERDGSFSIPTGEMILNTEWGSFDNELSILPNTAFDIAVDRESVHPGIQMFEKRVSGLFIGEILRHVLLDIAQYSSTFIIPTSSPLYEQYSMGSSFLSSAASDSSSDLKVISADLKRIVHVDLSTEDAKAVKKLVLAINKRAARLAGVAIAAVVLNSGRLSFALPDKTLTTRENTIPFTSRSDAGAYSSHSKSLAPAVLALCRRMRKAFRRSYSWISTSNQTSRKVHNGGQAIVDVGVDGSLIEFCPGFEDTMRSTLQDIEEIGIEGEQKITIGISKDGSGVGAALVARMAGL